MSTAAAAAAGQKSCGAVGSWRLARSVHCCYSCRGRRPCSVQQAKQCTGTSAWVCTYEKNTGTVPDKADGGTRTAGSDKYSQLQQYCAYGRVDNARCVGRSVVMMGSVHVACCVPGIWDLGLQPMRA